MKKKVIAVSGIIVLVIILLYGINNLPSQIVSNESSTNATDISVEAKVDEYSSLEEIENSVDVILKGEKISEEDPIIWRDEEGNVYFVGMIGNVKISKIYKDESNHQLKVDDTISVFENEAYDSKKNVIYHVADYKKMEMGKEYILFLNYSESDQWYVPCSAIWGKYPMDKSENILYEASTTRSMENSEYSLVNQIGSDAIEKYK